MAIYDEQKTSITDNLIKYGVFSNEIANKLKSLANIGEGNTNSIFRASLDRNMASLRESNENSFTPTLG